MRAEQIKRWRAFITGVSALALVCFCLLYIIFLTIPAHASVGSRASALTPLDTGTPLATDTSTPSPTVTTTPSPTDTSTPSPTVTSTPSPTATNTPSPTVTSTVYPYPTNPTTTPAPSPGSTRYVFPSPTTRATVGATARPSPTVAASPGASPTSTQSTDTNQMPGGSSTPTDNSSDSSNSGSNPLVNALLIILSGAGVTGLLTLLFTGVRIFLRKRLVPLPSPKLPPSGAAPWSRSPVGVQAQPEQPSPYAQMGYNPFYTPNGNGAPVPGSFNAAPTLANAPGAPWNGNQQSVPTTPPLLPGSVSADMMVVSDSYPQAMLNPYSHNGQVVQQAPEEFSERW